MRNHRLGWNCTTIDHVWVHHASSRGAPRILQGEGSGARRSFRSKQKSARPIRAAGAIRHYYFANTRSAKHSQTNVAVRTCAILCDPVQLPTSHQLWYGTNLCVIMMAQGDRNAQENVIPCRSSHALLRHGIE